LAGGVSPRAVFPLVVFPPFPPRCLGAVAPPVPLSRVAASYHGCVTHCAFWRQCTRRLYNAGSRLAQQARRQRSGRRRPWQAPPFHNCLDISVGFALGFIAGNCQADGPRAPTSCFSVLPGIGFGKYVNYYATNVGIGLTANSGIDSPPLTDGGYSQRWPTGAARIDADDRLRAVLSTCAALQPEMLCVLPEVHGMCNCCPEAGGGGCALLLEPLSDANTSLAAYLYHQAYLVLPVRAKHTFRIEYGPGSGTVVRQTLLRRGLASATPLSSSPLPGREPDTEPRPLASYAIAEAEDRSSSGMLHPREI